MLKVTMLPETVPRMVRCGRRPVESCTIRAASVTPPVRLWLVMATAGEMVAETVTVVALP